MSTVNRIRWGGLADLLAGLSWFMVSTFVGPERLEQDPLLALTGLLTLLGLFGLFAHDAGRSGRLSQIGIVLGLIGAAMVFLAHGAIAANLSIGYSANTVAIDFLGGNLLPIGLMVFGAGTLRLNTLPRWLVVVLLILPATYIVISILYLFLMMPIIPRLLFSMPWVILGVYLLWSSKDAGAPKGA